MDVLEEARSGGRGRKLRLPEGRWETRVKISEMRRCSTEVSWFLLAGLGRFLTRTYELGVELCEARLPCIVEHENSVDHGCLQVKNLQLRSV